MLLPAVVLRSARHRAPVIELGLFRVRSFAVANAGMFAFSTAFYALLLCNVLFLTEVWGYSILTAGFAVTPGPLMAALSAPIAGRLSDRFGQRVVALPGALFFAAGCILFATCIGATPHYVSEYLVPTMLTGTGVGFSFASWGSAAVAELPPTRFATGSAVLACLRQIGAVLGIAALVAVLERRRRRPARGLHRRLDADGRDRRRGGGARPRARARASGGAEARAMTGLELLRAIAAGEIPGPPIAELMGFERVAVEDGRVVFACVPGAQHYNPIGVVHGGLAATLLDSAMGCAVHSTLPAGAGYTTLELKVNFTRPITSETGRILCEGTVVHRGGRVATAEGRVIAEDTGKLLAHGTTTCLIFSPNGHSS